MKCLPVFTCALTWAKKLKVMNKDGFLNHENFFKGVDVNTAIKKIYDCLKIIVKHTLLRLVQKSTGFR